MTSAEYINSLLKENAELKAHIEYMKCCANCKFRYEGYGFCKPIPITGDGICEEWELNQ